MPVCYFRFAGILRFFQSIGCYNRGRLPPCAGAGNVTIFAKQDGNEKFDAAPDQNQSFEVNLETYLLIQLRV